MWLPSLTSVGHKLVAVRCSNLSNPHVTRTEPEPNPRFGVRCSQRTEPEPHMWCRFSPFLNLHLRFKQGCTWVHPACVTSLSPLFLYSILHLCCSKVFLILQILGQCCDNAMTHCINVHQCGGEQSL